jgi:predicted nucleic acid-binding protein
MWRTRGHVGATKRCRAVRTWRIAATTYMELAQGCRNRVELARLKRALKSDGAEVIQVAPDVSRRACDLIDRLALSHGVGLADALIGATAIVHGLPLLSANAKHLRPMDELMLEVFVP